MERVFAVFVLLVAVSCAHAQRIPVGDPLEDYARVLQVAGAADSAASHSVRPIPYRCDMGEEHPWQDRFPCAATVRYHEIDFGVVSPVAASYVNSRRPYGQNDGIVWQGRGATTQLAGGAVARHRFLTAVLRPQVVYTANADFELSALPVDDQQPPYAYPYQNRIDWPQRFGDDPFFTAAIDNSYLEAAFPPVAFGVSTENMWWGPALRNPLLMSNNAGGFSHAYLQTSRRVGTPIGSFDGRLIWGWLRHSDYYVDTSYKPDISYRWSEENLRFLTGLSVNWNPRWVPGLYLGMVETLMVHYSVDRHLIRDYLGLLNPPFFELSNDRERGTDDKAISFFARWVHPMSGVEVYGEWARGDHTTTIRDLFVEPDHSRAWTLGLQKIFRPSDRLWTRVLVETTNLEEPRAAGFRLQRGSYFYVHDGIRQGYTHKGQIMGAGIGPGANSQYLQFDAFLPWGLLGLHGLRWVHDNDRYYKFFVSDVRQTYYQHEVEFGGGGSIYAFLGDFEVGGSVTWTRLLNKDYVFKNDESNLNVQLSLRYGLDGFR